ncbi:hypothetical protein AB0K12_31600 [Nonomuraea sp. NPDC049419]|uniref:hypothetical protein n=1 Tax=Nonomuraea sp. NPDC049419 TaxID=3155772 RepID=UPI003430162C
MRRRTTTGPTRQAAAISRMTSDTGQVTNTEASPSPNAGALERLGPDLLSALYR